MERTPMDIKFVVIAESFNGESGEETVRAGEISPGVEEEWHATNPSIHPVERL